LALGGKTGRSTIRGGGERNFHPMGGVESISKGASYRTGRRQLLELEKSPRKGNEGKGALIFRPTEDRTSKHQKAEG